VHRNLFTCALQHYGHIFNAVDFTRGWLPDERTDMHGEVRRVRSGTNLDDIRRKTGELSHVLSRPATSVRVSRRVAPAGAKSTEIRAISNEQALSNLSLLATSAVILATSIFAGTFYLFASGQRYVGVAQFCGTGLLIAVIFCATLRLSEGHQPLKTSHILGRARSALVAWITSFAFFLAIAFTFKFGTDLSRGAAISFFLMGLVTVTSSHMHVPMLLARLLRSGAFIHRDIIVVGASGDPTIKRLIAGFQQGGCPALHAVEFDAACNAMEWPYERKALLNSIIALAHRLGPGEIYLASSQISQARAESILRSLTLVPRAVLVVPDEHTAQLLRHPLSIAGNEIAIDVQKVPMSSLGRTVKRVNDILLSLFAIAFLTPLFIPIIAAIKCDSRGPILFRQMRNGYQGRMFRILKFRTMTVMEDGDIINQACQNDLRVTRVGRWLRKTSLDELPQLFNVLRGEMSLIGPRPHARAHDSFYSKLIDNYEVRQHVKPGITGWAQVNGLRGETQTLDLMYRRIELDLWYAKNCSMLLDLRILGRTVLEVVRPRNAY
jgi:undecaprenyl-phosphate galactose phosphotransferase/putative colanic acid biosynthesis UDP-glucose lipid carrier transferase